MRDKNHIKSVEKDIAGLLKNQFKNKSGIIYCISRKKCEDLAENLSKNHGILADYYHAERTSEEKQKIQALWMENKI